MPYKLVRTSTGFFVENKDTGRRYSQEPMTRENAEKQMRVLYYSENRPDSSKTLRQGSLSQGQK